MQVAVGLIGMVALGVALVLGMRGAERGVAHLLGLPSFRWFDVADGSGWWWKRLLVRSASSLVPFATCAVTFTVVLAIQGVAENTTAVTVLPDGAARQAGMHDGDKVLAVGGVPVPTWDLAQLAVDRIPGALLLLFVLIPGVLAVWPLMWISARALWGKRALFGALLPVTLVPCVAPIMGTWLALRLRDEERRLRSHQSGAH